RLAAVHVPRAARVGARRRRASRRVVARRHPVRAVDGVAPIRRRYAAAASALRAGRTAPATPRVAARGPTWPERRRFSLHQEEQGRALSQRRGAGSIAGDVLARWAAL